MSRSLRQDAALWRLPSLRIGVAVLFVIGFLGSFSHVHRADGSHAEDHDAIPCFFCLLSHQPVDLIGISSEVSLERPSASCVGTPSLDCVLPSVDLLVLTARGPPSRVLFLFA